MHIAEHVASDFSGAYVHTSLPTSDLALRKAAARAPSTSLCSSLHQTFDRQRSVACTLPQQGTAMAVQPVDRLPTAPSFAGAWSRLNPSLTPWM